MTPKIFPTEVKKPVSRLCLRPGRKNKKKKERRECAFPRFHTALPFILLLSISLFLSVLRHRSLLSSLSSPSSRLSPPSIAHFSTIFPARSTSIVIVVVPRFHSGEFSRNLEVYSTSRIVLETKNEEPCYDGDWLIRYTVIRFFCGRFKILLFSYSIRFHVANRTNISPPPPPEFRMKFYRVQLLGIRVTGYLVPVVSRRFVVGLLVTLD